MRISDNLYDFLSWVGRLLLPCLSVLYATLGDIWGLPFTKEIPLTITAIDVFLNGLLGVSSSNYYKDKLENELTEKLEEDIYEQ